MIIDVHAHIFPAIRGRIADGPISGIGYGLAEVGGAEIRVLPPLCESTKHTPEMLVAHMDWTGVEKAVLLQGPFYGECNDYVRQAVRGYPDRLIGAAYLDPWLPDCRESLDSICASGGFRAVKLECSDTTGLCSIHSDARLDSPDVRWLWDELERSGLVLVLDLGAIGSRSYQTDAVRAIAEEHPSLRVVIAHLGQPNPAAESDPTLWRTWEDQISLGKLPNVWFDTASLPCYMSAEGYPFPSAGRYIRTAVDRIGPEKIMWGTDIPGLLLHATYPQLVRMAHVHLDFLPLVHRALILGDTASRVFGL